MAKKIAKIYIGTSGWAYDHWQGIFYPKDLPPKNRLKYFSQHFKTVEINYSFYQSPKTSTYQEWFRQTPPDFLFSLKASRFITHIKRLKEVRTPWRNFLKGAILLKQKLGPVLLQFPPSFRASQENIERLEKFLKYAPLNKKGEKICLALEFRHLTWFQKSIYQLLKRYNVAWVIADSNRYPKDDQVTADFAYIRMHGPDALFSSKYTKKDLISLAKKIKRWQKECSFIYCYFNNDFHGYALANAKELLEILKN